MLGNSGMLVLALGAVLFAPGAALAQFVACAVRTCEKPTVQLQVCTGQFLLFTTTDPGCEARNAALLTQAESVYQACLTQQRIDQANCQVLNETRTLEQSTGKILMGDVFLMNGAVCGSSQECASGYCLPGPDLKRAESSAPEKSSVTWYCTSEKASCALPGAEGGTYGDVFELNGLKLVCQNPGRGLWGQFYPPE